MVTAIMESIRMVSLTVEVSTPGLKVNSTLEISIKAKNMAWENGGLKKIKQVVILIKEITEMT